MDYEKNGIWVDERRRQALVEKILEKSTFAGVTGRTIAEYSKDLEHYIITGELLDKTKTKDQVEWQTRSI